jgi:hypothetical protein
MHSSSECPQLRGVCALSLSLTSRSTLSAIITSTFPLCFRRQSLKLRKERSCGLATLLPNFSNPNTCRVRLCFATRVRQLRDATLHFGGDGGCGYCSRSQMLR